MLKYYSNNTLHCNRLSTVLNANRIVFIDKGEVVEQGTHSELIAKKGRYYQLTRENEADLGTDVVATSSTDVIGKRKSLIILIYNKLSAYYSIS